MIQPDHPKLSIVRQCRRASVSRSTLYHAPRGESAENLALMAEIERQFPGLSTYISVTQQFNTTTSMGRLTLNMLVSFAQFEREVTGERIRERSQVYPGIRRSSTRNYGMRCRAIAVPLGQGRHRHQHRHAGAGEVPCSECVHRSHCRNA